MPQLHEDVGLESPRDRQLRSIVATIEHQLSNMGRAAPLLEAEEAHRGALHAAWAELVKVLALGDAPAVRKCPVCNRIGMREATRCHHCWADLAPQDSPDSVR